jgi:hypothetical protein
MLLLTTFLENVLLVFLVIKAGEPGCETLDGNLELGMEVDEGAQLIGQPRQSHLIIAPTGLELLDTSISEIHKPTRQATAASNNARCCCR